MNVVQLQSRERDFHDFAIGDRMQLGPVTVGHLQALDFARAYDPLPFLLSEDGAADHPLFARMAVSGWLVAALVNRLMVEEYLANPVAVVGEPGVERLRWLRPVYPGDQISVEVDVTGTRLLARHPGLGLVRQRLRARNQDRLPVMTARLGLLVRAPARTHVVNLLVDG